MEGKKNRFKSVIGGIILLAAIWAFWIALFLGILGTPGEVVTLIMGISALIIGIATVGVIVWGLVVFINDRMP